MKRLPSILWSTFKVLVAIVVLVVLVLTAVRLLLTPLFLEIEYRLPGFPEDSYGFTQEDRLTWAPLALDYLLNAQDIDFLADLQFEDGSPLYNQRELRHMQDVKELTSAALTVWLAGLLFLLGLGLWALRGDWWRRYRGMLAAGGRLAVILIAVLLFSLLLSFRQVFTAFHHVFFEGDSWLFLYSDTLIRLFPQRFWQDAFLFIGAFTLLAGLALWLLLGRREKAE